MMAHKIILYAKLEDLYSSDLRLNRRIFDNSIKSGLEAMLNQINPNGDFDEVKGYTPWKVKDVPLLEEDEYEEYYKMMEGYEFPLFLSKEDLN